MSGKFAGRRGLVDRFLAAHTPVHQGPYWRLVTAVRAKTSILAPQQMRADGDIESLLNVCQLLSRVGRWYRVWQRPLEQWTPPTTGSILQIRSLIDHLLVKYPVPAFLYQPWLTGRPDWIRVFIRVALGQSPRTALRNSGLFQDMTKKMTHLFLQAPSHYSPSDALRWAQIVGWGGSEEQARRWIDAQFVIPELHREFWPEWIRFLLSVEDARPTGPSVLRLSIDEMKAIERFIIEQKFLPAARVLGYRTGNDRPLQPLFSLQGRTLRSIRRHMRNWRNEVRLPPCTTGKTRWLSWRHSDIEDWQIHFDSVDYSIEELLNAHELVVEGGILGHCVATYAHQCYRGQTTIWSLRMNDEGRNKRLVTIEVCPYSRQIIMARGRRNRLPTPQQQHILELWAKAASLNE